MSAVSQAADAHNALLAGTSVVVGKATMLLVETGARTRFAAIASALAANVPPTALEQGVRPEVRKEMLELELRLK